jgi:hypothetical protein
MLDLPNFMVRPLPMESENRNTPAIDYLWIDFAVAVLVRYLFPSSAEPDDRPIVGTVRILEILSVTSTDRVILDTTHCARSRHPTPTPDLDVVTTREIERLIVLDPGEVKMRTPDTVAVV